MHRNLESLIFALPFLLSLLAVPAANAGSPGPTWFTSLDADRSGTITIVEIHHARWARFAKHDANRNGYLERAEISTSKAWLKYFGWYDENRDEQISITEFEAKGQERFALMDLNDDGQVTLEELHTLAKS